MAEKEYDNDRKPGEGFNTMMLHCGHKATDEPQKTRAVPIHMSTSFVFNSVEHAAKLFMGQELGNIYTRIMNPTTHVLEYRVSKLEGSKCDLDGAHPSALATASGQAAQFHTALTLMKAGDWMISASDLYGGTFTQFGHTFPKLGLNVKFIDGQKLEELEAAFEELGEDNVKMVYFETLGNPSYNVPDFEGVAAICKKRKTAFVVDNTFGMCGYVCRPFKFGADIVVESATKWLGGHGTTIGGMIVDNNTFDWSVQTADGKSKYPALNDPQPMYHGLNFNAVFGPKGPFGCNMAFIVHARFCALRDMGGCQNPMGSWNLIQGLETLSLRGKAHCENTNELAAWLKSHPAVEFCSHPSLPDHPAHERAKKYFRANSFGAVLCFGVKKGPECAREFTNKCNMASHLANVGDAKTLVICPSATTHSQLSEAEMKSAGVQPNMIRVSVGYEDIEDIKADFEQAFKAAGAV